MIDLNKISYEIKVRQTLGANGIDIEGPILLL